MTTRTERRPAALPTPLAVGGARTAYELLAFVRERDAMIFIFGYPLLMLPIFATVFAGQAQGGQGASIPFAQYFLPGMVATGVMLSSFQTLAIGIAAERDDGTLKRLRATPVSAVGYFLGKTGQVLVVGVVQTTLLLILAAVAFDVPLPDSLDRWATFAWVFVLGTATGAVCGVAFSSVPRSGRSASAVVTSVVLVLQFISGVFFPFFDLPGWMQAVASVFPLRWIAQGMRAALLPEQAAALEVGGEWQLPVVAAVVLAWGVVGLVAGARTFRWRRRDDG
ncbi:ABC-2 type transporter [Beutenbergia cavernae DSM 12333]|uniref:Transport permease protein n=1 Tax=Beutenbergia cavernae (strain ATCC BAA-8 / DSM 12333 / CCUG 43141 / JCM 11478 / NBRC 16432 / NCIMB 13614 / HKI 0122) TaxID=471853 RepID=C5C0M0_BEUC1|nr:ABC transporter permease [Beutenbergia cavernae]ACQ81416.1 ABC-2 type transporter [Beutenbergia cavernae DSM 12333]